MQNFAHITDLTLRTTLEGDFDEDSICQSLTITGAALKSDLNNEEVSYKAIAIREQAYDEAMEAWNEAGDAAACIEALRTFWSN